MILTAEKKWLFGSFLIFASNRFVARRAYEILVRHDCEKRAGTLSLDTGEQVQWMNCASRNRLAARTQ